jgi:hypothetical protein
MPKRFASDKKDARTQISVICDVVALFFLSREGAEQDGGQEMHRYAAKGV